MVLIAESICVSVVALKTLLLSVPKPLSVVSLRESTELIPMAKTSCELDEMVACVAPRVE